MVTLIDDLLDISRITRGKVELNRTRVDMRDVVSQAIEMSAPLMAALRHDCGTDIADEPLWVDGDPARLAQIVSNLLTNAAKYTPAAGRITVRAEREGDCVVVRVKDNGIGISPEMMPKIFDLFMQEGQSLERDEGGLGLGLAIVQNLVTLHGGTVEAMSPGRDQGSEFIVRLPALTLSGDDAEPEAPGGRLEEMGQRKSRGYRILVVDDNVDAAAALGLWLELEGHLVQVAHDGEEALARVEHWKPDLALLDIGLPRMSGYELAQHLHACPGLSELPIVAVSGYGQKADRERSRQAGFFAHLTKPVGLERLGPLIESLLSDAPPAD